MTSVTMPLFDRFIDLVFHYRELQGDKLVDKKLAIKCPRAHRKPKLSFSYERVEDGTVYNCKIIVYNLYLQMRAIDVDSIDVTAGYAYSAEHSDSFTCQVFSAYTPQPGPDGYTVFDCIIASANDVKSFSFALYNSSTQWTRRQVITDTCARLGLRAVFIMEDRILDDTFSSEDIPPIEFVNYLGVIGFLQRSLNNIGIAQKQHKFVVSTLLFNDVVYFIGITAEEKSVTVEVSKALTTQEAAMVYQLDKISSADWNAGSLSVTAPWVPELHPGSLFKISPYFYNGADLPNEVSRVGEQKDPMDYYYIIQMSVDFDTIDKNEMSILAIPFKYSPINNQSTTSTSPEKAAHELHEIFKSSKKIVESIVFGEGSSAIQEEDAKVKDIKDLTLNIPSAQGYIIKPGDSLSKVAEAFEIPPLVGRLNGIQKSVPGSQAGYPLILLQTYTKFKSGDSKYQINPATPDAITVGNMLSVPGVSWQYLYNNFRSKMVQIYKTCYEYYASNTTVGAWARSAKLCAELFEEGVI